MPFKKRQKGAINASETSQATPAALEDFDLYEAFFGLANEATTQLGGNAIENSLIGNNRGEFPEKGGEEQDLFSPAKVEAAFFGCPEQCEQEENGEDGDKVTSIPSRPYIGSTTEELFRKLIKERARAIWLSNGQPDDKESEIENWLQAEREISEEVEELFGTRPHSVLRFER